jgi:hypothetical protein
MKLTKEQLEQIVDEKARKIINEMRLVESSDGWNKEELENIGFMDWLSAVEEVAYDVRNCVRGAYCDAIGSTYEELGAYLRELAETANAIADELIQDGGRYEEEEDYDEETSEG